jgi:hypothetical protein
MNKHESLLRRIRRTVSELECEAQDAEDIASICSMYSSNFRRLLGAFARRYAAKTRKELALRRVKEVSR